MTDLRLALIAGLTAIVFGGAPDNGPNAQAPTFRGVVDGVSVDVVVRQGGHPASGLTSADFLLEDDGVRQDVEAVPMNNLPVDVTLAMDVSGSMLKELDRVKADVRAIAAMLRPGDRFRLVTFARDVRQIEPMQEVGPALQIGGITAGSSTSMNDALLYALAWPPEPQRRHLVVVFTDGYDTSSFLDDAIIPQVAAHADAVLHAVLSAVVPGVGDLARSRTALEQAAVLTGGQSHQLSDTVKSFKEVFDEFRTSYVLRYTFHGPRRAGWHDITVSVGRPGAFTVRARKGYFGM